MSAAIAFAGAAAAADGGVSQIIAAAVAVSRVGVVESTASLRYKADGSYQTIRNASITSQGDWVLPAGRANEWEVRASVTGDPLTSGSTGVWQALTTDRTWSITQTGEGEKSTALTLEFRRVSGAGDIVNITPNTLEADVVVL